MQWSAADSVWILGNEHEITVSCKCGFSTRNFAMKYQMVLRHKVLPAWEQYHLQTELLTLQLNKNHLLFLQASPSLAMNLLFGQHKSYLRNIFLDCLFPTLHSSYITVRVFCQWFWQDASQKSSCKWWYPLSLWICFHCRWIHISRHWTWWETGIYRWLALLFKESAP